MRMVMQWEGTCEIIWLKLSHSEANGLDKVSRLALYHHHNQTKVHLSSSSDPSPP